jgi:6-phosphogluconolactonase
VKTPTPLSLITGDRAEIERALVSSFQNAASDAIAAHGEFLVALSGGSIAPLFFPALARLPLDWSRVDFFWADERAVPPEHPDSNYGEAMRLWLTPAGVPPGRIHRMHGEDPDLRHAAQAYGAALGRIAGSPPALDFVLLGVGPDGHVASLFPGHPALKEDAEVAVPIEDAPKPPSRRITLTLPVLAAAATIVVAAQGEAKAGVIRQALTPGSSLPLAMLISRARNVRLLLVN